MKLLPTTLFIYLFTIALGYAQKPEPAQAQVKYHFTHIRDTTQRDRPYTETLILLLSRNASAYTSLDAKLQAENMNKELQEQVKNAPDPNNLDLVLSNMRGVSNEEYYQFNAEHKLFIKEKLGNNYLIAQPLPQISWKISSDTLTINGLHCQKATALFKGRNYEAWFCADLPFHSGPWKLNGLPGLIIKAADSKREVIFNFAGFDDVSSQGLTVGLPTEVIATTQKEFDRLKELRKTNPQAFSQIHSTKVEKSPMDEIDVNKIKSMTIKPSTDNFSRTINNPIELPEKK